MALSFGLEPKRFRGALTVRWVYQFPQDRTISGAAMRNRTPDLLLTRQPLYQLSYNGVILFMVLPTGYDPVSYHYQWYALPIELQKHHYGELDGPRSRDLRRDRPVL